VRHFASLANVRYGSVADHANWDMSAEINGDDGGPSERAVALARTWLVITGVAILAFGIFAATTSEGTEMLMGCAITLLGLADLVVARYGSRRVAVFFSLFVP
jgi:hypothetical protein